MWSAGDWQNSYSQSHRALPIIFLAVETKIFNVGNYRHKLFGANLPTEFSNHSNEEFSAKMNEVRSSAYSDLIGFMWQDGVRVGAHDATSSTQRGEHTLESVSIPASAR